MEYFGQMLELDPRRRIPAREVRTGLPVSTVRPVAGSGSKKNMYAVFLKVELVSGGIPVPSVETTMIGRLEENDGTSPAIFK
jgi:hypothetical protein